MNSQQWSQIALELGVFALVFGAIAFACLPGKSETVTKARRAILIISIPCAIIGIVLAFAALEYARVAKKSESIQRAK